MAFDSTTAAMAGKKSSREGKPNKTTQEIRSLFQELLEKNLETLQADIESLKPADRLRVVIDMAKFVIPTLRSTELKSDEGEFKTITIDFRD